MSFLAAPVYAYDFNVLSGVYHQPFYVNVFLGPVAPQIRWESIKNETSFIDSKLVTPMLPGMKHPPQSEDRADEIRVDDPPAGMAGMERRSAQQEPLDATWLSKATGEAISITDQVKAALEKAGAGMTADKLLAENLSWNLYGVTDKKFIDLSAAPIKIWATELKNVGPLVVPRVLFEAVQGKPGALRKGESQAIEEFFQQDFAMPELED